MDAQAFQAIQAKIHHQRGEMGNQAAAEVPIDWPPPHGVRVHSSAVRAAETVDMLQRRSRQSGGAPSPSVAQGKPRSPSGSRRTHPAVYRRRMASMAQRINDLSLEQEQAIAEMQWVQQQLASLAPESFAADPPAINFDQAITAWASLDAAGRVVLSYRPVEPLAAPEAHALAHHLRQVYGTQGRRAGAGRLGPMLRRLGAWITEAIPTGAPTLDRVPSPAPSATEAMLWAGAGVAGRLVMQGLLLTLPSLGIVAVVACLASLALTLYRAILPPAPDINLISRVGLALAGLIIGGYLL